jgi:hypothetical protein
MSGEWEPVLIRDRLLELEMEANFLVGEINKLRDAYALGYRYVDEDDQPWTGSDNVINIAEKFL